jgi:hypothetical protein
MRSVRLGIVVSAVLALTVAGCGGGDEGGSQSPAANASSDASVSLAGTCPATIVVQTDWDPESEYGVYYHMLGPNPKVDTQHKRVTGPLVVEGKDTGVQLEVRTGGPSIGFEPVSSQMYKDTSITLGQVSTDEAIRFSNKQATQAVVAPMEKSPFMIMWDPATYPQVNTIADIGKTDTKVLYFEGDTYMAYLTGTKVLKKSQVDGSYDGKPANFVAANGKIAQPKTWLVPAGLRETTVSPSRYSRIPVASTGHTGGPSLGFGVAEVPPAHRRCHTSHSTVAVAATPAAHTTLQSRIVPAAFRPLGQHRQGGCGAAREPCPPRGSATAGRVGRA